MNRGGKKQHHPCFFPPLGRTDYRVGQITLRCSHKTKILLPRMLNMTSSLGVSAVGEDVPSVFQHSIKTSHTPDHNKFTTEVQRLNDLVYGDLQEGKQIADMWYSYLTQLPLISGELCEKRDSSVDGKPPCFLSFSSLRLIHEAVTMQNEEEKQLALEFPLDEVPPAQCDVVRRRYLEDVYYWTQKKRGVYETEVEISRRYPQHMKKLGLLHELFVHLDMRRSSHAKHLSDRKVRAALAHLQHHKHRYAVGFLQPVPPTPQIEDLNKLLAWLGCEIKMEGKQTIAHPLHVLTETNR